MGKIFKSFVPALVFCSLFLSPAFSQEYGLVLSGGGGKGAYEVGVWKALNEYGLAQKVTVISGTSVGGLNGALFACENLETVLFIWREVVPELMFNHTDEFIDEEGLLQIINQVDVDKLLRKDFFPRVYITATRARFWALKLLSKYIFDGDYSHRFLLNEQDSVDEIRQMLLATSAFPILTKSVTLADGYEYVDGGASDNIPFAPLEDDENWSSMDQILVVYLDSKAELISEKYAIISDTFPDLPVIDFVPSCDLGGVDAMIDFSREAIDDLIRLGYKDAVQILRNAGYKPVSGYWFY